MPIILQDGTQVKQRQVDKSAVVNDSLDVPTLSYKNQKSLEDDLNYIRSILKQIKGTENYDSPLLKSLEVLRQELEDAVFHNATLTGEPVATTPPTEDDSDRIATTAFVSSKLDGILSGQPGDKFYKFKDYQNSGSGQRVWHVHHDLDKFPSVTVVRGNDPNKIQSYAKVTYIDRGYLVIEFNEDTYGVAYLN